MGGASKQIHAKKMKKEKEAAEAAKKVEEEVRWLFHIHWVHLLISGHYSQHLILTLRPKSIETSRFLSLQNTFMMKVVSYTDIQ